MYPQENLPQPRVFNKEMYLHYHFRVEQVIAQGKRYTPEYFYVRNKMRSFKKLITK